MEVVRVVVIVNVGEGISVIVIGDLTGRHGDFNRRCRHRLCRRAPFRHEHLWALHKSHISGSFHVRKVRVVRVGLNHTLGGRQAYKG